MFALADPIVNTSEDALGSMMNPEWKVTAKVNLVDQSGKNANPQWVKGLIIQLRPDFYTTANEFIKIFVPEINNSLPNIVLTVPKFGSQAIDLSAGNIVRDYYHKTIEVKEPVVIQQFPEIEAELGAVTTTSQCP